MTTRAGLSIIWDDAGRSPTWNRARIPTNWDADLDRLLADHDLSLGSLVGTGRIVGYIIVPRILNEMEYEGRYVDDL